MQPTYRRWHGSTHGWGRARALAICSIVLVTLSCSSTLGDTPQVALIEISPFSAEVDIGASVTLVASVLDAAGRVITAGEPVVWTSAPLTIATIDATGKATGVSPGVARVTARRGNVVGTASVTVRVPAPARVDFPAVGSAISRGDTLRLAARATSVAGVVYTGRGFSWRTSNAAIATITPSADSSTALLTAGAPGSATITATNFGVEGSTTITVSPDPVIAVSLATVAFQGTVGGADQPTQVVNITNAGGGVLRGLAVSSIVYNEPPAIGWLRATLAGGVTAPQVSVTTSPRGLAIGNYAAVVTITSTSPAVVPRVFNVTLAVAPPPSLTLSSPTVLFGSSLGGALPAPQTVAVTNTGGGTLTSLVVSSPTTSTGQPAPWLSATLSSTSAPAILTFVASPAGLAIGTYSASVGVSSAGATGSPRTVAVTLVVSQNSIIIAAPTSLLLSAAVGANPSPATIAISNGGGGALTGLSLGMTQYGAGQPTNWLVATIGAAQAPTQITVSLTTAALAPGSYSATFPVQSSQFGVSAATVTVNLTVRTVATIVPTTTNVTITASPASSNPSAIVGITNGSSGALAGLSATTTYAASQSSGWLTTSFSGATSAPTSLTLQPVATSLAVGTYNATVQISSPNAATPVDIAVTFIVTGFLQPGSTTIALFGAFGVGSSAVDGTSITNGGVGFIDGLTSSVTYNSGAGWLSTSLTKSTTPATLLAQANPAPTAPRGLSSATLTVRGINVLPITVIISREIGYTYERHVVSATTNVFNSLGCYGCHSASSSRPIPFGSYTALIASAYYFNPASRNPTSSYLYNTITGGSHSGGTYLPGVYPEVALLRDWISDGTRQR